MYTLADPIEFSPEMIQGHSMIEFNDECRVMTFHQFEIHVGAG